MQLRTEMMVIFGRVAAKPDLQFHRVLLAGML
jgi:hypothetical protein